MLTWCGRQRCAGSATGPGISAAGSAAPALGHPDAPASGSASNALPPAPNPATQTAGHQHTYVCIECTLDSTSLDRTIYAHTILTRRSLSKARLRRPKIDIEKAAKRAYTSMSWPEMNRESARTSCDVLSFGQEHGRSTLSL